MSMKKKLTAGVALGLAVALGCAVPAMADSRKVVTLGANLTSDQQDTMMRYFGVSSDSVDIIYINNTQEREQLLSYVPEEQIGTKTFSCALVSPTSSGGIQVKTANLNWVTCNMIASTLSTSGVTNCQVVAAAPFEVSGTGALTGVILAYETASDTTLDPVKKNLANEELVTTGNLSDRVGSSKATAVINETKLQVIENNVTDIEEITQIINDVSITYNVTIEDDESEEIAELMQQIAEQDYDIAQLKATLDRVQANVAGDAGASEEEQAELESEAEASEQTALEEALAEQAAEGETESDSSVVVIDETTGMEETENILDNTDSSVLGENGSEVVEGTTTQTVQEQSEAAVTETDTVPETTAETSSDSSGEITIPEATGDTTDQSENTDSILVVEEPVTEVQTSETDSVVTAETSEIPEATGDEFTTAETSADGTDTSETTVEETSAETLTPDMLDTEDRSTYDSAVQGIDSEFEGDQVVSEDGSTTVYLTSEAAQEVPDAIEAYVLKVLAKGADTVAAEEAADTTISQNIMEETQSLAADPNYTDPDLTQIDKYVRRLILQDSEGMLEESQVTELDKQVIYTAVMEELESAFGVVEEQETTAETSAEDAQEWVEDAEEVASEAAAEAEEWLDDEAGEVLDDIEEYF